MVSNERIEQIVKNTTDFVVYVHSYYGPKGIYDMGATIEQICEATKILLNRFDINEIEFDTTDRERVRDIMIEHYGLVFPLTSTTPSATSSLLEAMKKAGDLRFNPKYSLFGNKDSGEYELLLLTEQPDEIIERFKAECLNRRFKGLEVRCDGVRIPTENVFVIS